MKLALSDCCPHPLNFSLKFTVQRVCRGMSRAAGALLRRKYLPRLFQAASSFRCARARARVHSIPPSRAEEGEGEGDSHRREFISIVFPANKRELSLVHRRRRNKIAKVRLKLRLRRGDEGEREEDNRERVPRIFRFRELPSRRIRSRFSYRSNSDRKAAP